MIVNNPRIKAELINRWTEMGIYSVSGKRSSYAPIIRDAQERAPQMKITADRLTKYLNDLKGGLSEIQIRWLLTRYGIPAELIIGNPEILEGKVEFVIPPYNEIDAIKQLKEIWG